MRDAGFVAECKVVIVSMYSHTKSTYISLYRMSRSTEPLLATISRYSSIFLVINITTSYRPSFCAILMFDMYFIVKKQPRRIDPKVPHHDTPQDSGASIFYQPAGRPEISNIAKDFKAWQKAKKKRKMHNKHGLGNLV